MNVSTSEVAHVPHEVVAEQTKPVSITPAVSRPVIGPKRLVALDVLRAVAILLVLGHHMPVTIPENTFAQPFFALWRRVGWAGVDLFFVLSGFLIGSLLFASHSQSGSFDVKRFYVRRAFKIWPPYIVFLFATFIVFVWTGSGGFWPQLEHAWHELWPNFLHIQNYTRMPNAVCHTWSLAVEEHFYLMLPLALVVLFSSSGGYVSFRRLFGLFIAIALICLGMRFATAVIWPVYELQVHYFPTHLRIDSLLAGVVLSYAVVSDARFVAAARRYKWILLLLGAICFTPVAFFDLETSTFIRIVGFTMIWFGSACIVMFAWLAEGHSVLKWPVVRALAGIGFCSYSIYLWHVQFAGGTTRFLARLVDLESFWAVPILVTAYLGLAFFLGWISIVLIERPALRLRSRFFPAH